MKERCSDVSSLFSHWQSQNWEVGRSATAADKGEAVEGRPGIFLRFPTVLCSQLSLFLLLI